MIKSVPPAMTTLVFACAAPLFAQADAVRPSANAPREWLTKAERTDFRETCRYDETVEFCRALDAASDWITYTTFGKSPLGRDLPLVIAASGGEFDPQKAKASGKPIVLVQNAIHPGECDGKDASLMLLRDIAVTRTRADLLRNAILLIVPIYNVDGHERFGPYNRINQNGPAEMGWRTTAQNYNLNRDYVKADAPETRALLALWNRWQPDLHLDTHTTDGGDWQYDMMPAWETSAMVSPSIARWHEEVLKPRLFEGLTADGHVPMTYFDLVDSRDPTKGIGSGPFEPRFASGYIAIRNRPSILVESHMLKPNRTRIMGQYSVLRHTIELANAYASTLREAVAAADSEASSLGKEYDPNRKIALGVTTNPEKSTPLSFKGYAFERQASEVSGTDWIRYDSTKPETFEIPYYNQFDVTLEIAPPAGYVIPPQWTAAVEMLDIHGLAYRRLEQPAKLEVESYRFREPKFAARGFEGRVRVSFTAELQRGEQAFPAGSVVVPLSQPGARLAMHLFEPQASDSLMQWGFFNAILEQKEYAEGYILEKLARDMMAADPGLKKEFEEKVAADAEFAKDPRARLNFFYHRSAYFDRQLGAYPVCRLLRMPVGE